MTKPTPGTWFEFDGKLAEWDGRWVVSGTTTNGFGDWTHSTVWDEMSMDGIDRLAPLTAGEWGDLKAWRDAMIGELMSEEAVMLAMSHHNLKMVDDAWVCKRCESASCDLKLINEVPCSSG